MKIACFYDFWRKNQFLPIFYTQNDHFSIFEGVLMLWRHSDVIHKWLVFILVSMERGCPYLYTGSKFRVIWPSELIIRRGQGCNNPLRKICLGKTLRRTRVKLYIFGILMTRQTIWHYFSEKSEHVSIFDPCGALKVNGGHLESGTICGIYQKNVAYALFTLPTKFHTFNRYCPIMQLSCA